MPVQPLTAPPNLVFQAPPRAPTVGDPLRSLVESAPTLSESAPEWNSIIESQREEIAGGKGGRHYYRTDGDYMKKYFLAENGNREAGLVYINYWESNYDYWADDYDRVSGSLTYKATPEATSTRFHHCDEVRKFRLYTPGYTANFFAALSHKDSKLLLWHRDTLEHQSLDWDKANRIFTVWKDYLIFRSHQEANTLVLRNLNDPSDQELKISLPFRGDRLSAFTTSENYLWYLRLVGDDVPQIFLEAIPLDQFPDPSPIQVAQLEPDYMVGVDDVRRGMSPYLEVFPQGIRISRDTYSGPAYFRWLTVE